MSELASVWSLSGGREVFGGLRVGSLNHAKDPLYDVGSIPQGFLESLGDRRALSG